ncbi:hypothetical protein [Escherichia coli]|nr:hypothetical protein [Escherichia coli]
MSDFFMWIYVGLSIVATTLLAALWQKVSDMDRKLDEQNKSRNRK